MKYSLFPVVLAAMFLVACDEKPGQHPPSLYEEREGMLSDEELESSKQDADKKDSWGILSDEVSE